MPLYDNPAGRLHELLRKLSEQSLQNGLGVSWARVLGVPANEVQLHIGAVADLVRQIEDAVDRLDDDDLRAPVVRLRDTWMRAIVPMEQAFKSKLGTVCPPPEALESLALVSKQLHLVASEGEVPEQDILDQLRERLHSLIGDLRESTDLSDDLKQAIVSRLMDVAKAIEHVHVGGPDAVRLATEAVLGTVMFSPDRAHAGGTSSFKKVCATLGAVWFAFTAAPVIQDSIEAVSTLVHEIESGQVVNYDGGAQSTQVTEAETP